MSKTIRGDEMAAHLRRLREAMSLLNKSRATGDGMMIQPEDYGRARGLIVYTLEALTSASVTDVVIEDIAP